MPAFPELPLVLWCIGRGDDERGAVAQVRIGAIEPVRPQRAIGTALAHVVDDEEIGLTGWGSRVGSGMATRSSDRESVMADEIDLSSHFGHACGWEGRWVDMGQLRGVIARRRKRTVARASPSRSSWSCKYSATRTG